MWSAPPELVQQRDFVHHPYKDGWVVNCQSHFDDWFKGVDAEIVKVNSGPTKVFETITGRV